MSIPSSPSWGRKRYMDTTPVSMTPCTVSISDSAAYMSAMQKTTPTIALFVPFIADMYIQSVNQTIEVGPGAHLR